MKSNEAASPLHRHLFDIQVNGYGGIDFQRDTLTDAQLEHAVVKLNSHGTGRILLTLITDSIDRLCRKLEAVERIRLRNTRIGLTVAGYHLEGPYLNPADGFAGAHNRRLMRKPSLAEFNRLWDAAGAKIRLITLAPELPGSVDFIRHAVRHGVRIAIGHSNADDLAIDDAIRAGLSLCTHLGNGIPQLMHRHDNIVQRLLARDELYAAFIPDGIHLPPYVLRNLVRAKPQNKVLFTTDCMAAAAAPPGTYNLGSLKVRVGSDGVVRQPGKEGYFAGSSLTMDVAVENVQRFLGWPKAKSVQACSTKVDQFLNVGPC